MQTISNETLQQYTDLLKSNEKVMPDIYFALLSQLNPQQQDWLRQQAAQTAVGQFGKGIYVRALIEISNYCKNKIVLIDKRLETAQERIGRIRRGEYEKTERIGSCNTDDKSLLQKET